MKTSTTRFLSIALGAAMAVGTLFATTSANAAGTNLIADSNLRTCLAYQMWYMGIGSSPGGPAFQEQTQSITQDDLDALGAGGLQFLYCSGVSTLDGLENFTNSTVQEMDFPGGSITDLTPLAGLTSLKTLDVSNNQISSVAPLAGLTNLTTLLLHNNDITDITPIAPLLNATKADGSPAVKWTLSNNQITDASSVAWSVNGTAWLTVASEYYTDVYTYTVTGQSIPVGDAVTGTTIDLPTVKQFVGDPYGLKWSVQGNATLNADNTLTFTSPGPVALSWIDDMTLDCPADSAGTVLCPNDANKINLSPFSGTFNWNVSDGTATTTPSVPDSDVAKPDVISPETTGGAARLADGSDTYTLVTAVRNEAGTPLIGYMNRLHGSATSDTADASQVQFSNFRNNPDPKQFGTYLVDISSAIPGNFVVTIALDGQAIDTTTELGDEDAAPIIPSDPKGVPVNFIGADIAQPTRYIGDTQSSDGLGFLPGEDVTVTVHSDPLSLGSYKANTIGNVNVSFMTDKLDVQRHTVIFEGAVSGTVMVGFDIVNKPKGDTGGSAMTDQASGKTALVLVFAFAAAGVFSLGMGLKRRTR